MLNLASTTRETWVSEALSVVDVILLDHAHCEKKAASTAMNLIFRYTGRVDLLRPLSEIAREELEHFELMLGVLEERKIEFVRLEPSLYGSKLHQVVRKPEPHRLLDTLLCCGMIEARSCERMQILAEALPQPELKELYQSLLASEARHHGTYRELAHKYFPREEVKARLLEVAAHEAAVLEETAPQIRLHS